MKQIKAYKIPAFTMMDMLTGMVIMSIVIAIVFYMMTNTNQQVHAFGQTRADIVEFNLMQADMYGNVDRADEVLAIPNGFELVFDDHTITYTLEGQTLMRKEGLTETILSEHVDQVLTVTDDQGLGETNMVTSVLISSKIERKELKLYLYKTYDNQALMNQKLLSELKN